MFYFGPADRQKEVTRLVRLVTLELRKLSPPESRRFDLELMAVLAACLDTELPVGASGGRLVSVADLADELNKNRLVVQARLKTLACYGFILCLGHQDGLKRRTEVVANPAVVDLLVKGSQMTQLAKLLAERGVCRAADAKDLQGFSSHVPFGEPERPTTGIDGTSTLIPGSMFALACQGGLAGGKSEKAAKVAERMAKLKADQDFIERCGLIWTAGQLKAGRMKITAPLAPTWSKPGKLAPAVSKERIELVRLLEQHGKEHVGMAWLYWNGHEATLDAKSGKPAYLPAKPHLQFVTVDKKPSQFSKHFNAIMLDGAFKGALTDEAWKARHKHWFDEPLLPVESAPPAAAPPPPARSPHWSPLDVAAEMAVPVAASATDPFLDTFRN